VRTRAPRNRRASASLGSFPNYRTSPSLKDSEPLTRGEKFKIATEDAFDRGTFALAALFAGESKLTNANPSFGQGAAGYGRYFAISFADFAIGDYITSSIKTRGIFGGTGTGWSRLSYAAGQIFWTHGDSGNTHFNFSELIGNSSAVAISNAYYFG
jgi:hypothetical protein